MSAIEVVLVYVCIPAGVLTCIVLAVILPGLSRRPRYRPGEPWEHEPVWYCPHPAALDAELQKLTHRPERPAIGAAARRALTASSSGEERDGGAEAEAAIPAATARGGAHGEW